VNDASRDWAEADLGTEPSLEEAAWFLEALAGQPDPVVTFQTFDDVEKRKVARAKEKDPFAAYFHGRLADHSSRLSQFNRQRAGVFVMVNEGDGLGRGAKNVRALRALFVDDDTGTLNPRTLAVKPSLVVKTRAGFHCYWLLRPGEPLEAFRPAQEALAKRLRTDNVIDLPRVLRLPGFYHCKEAPSLMIRAVRELCDPSLRYSIREVLDGLGARLEEPKKAAEAARPAAQDGTLEAAVERFNRDHHRELPKHNAPGPCPVCRDVASFHELKPGSARWFCFSSDHPAYGVGLKSDTGTGFHGDALDLAAYAAGMKRLAHLQAEGYWTPPRERKNEASGQRESPPCSDDNAQPLEDPFAALGPDSTLAQVGAALEAWASMLAKMRRAARGIERERAVAAVGQVKVIKGPARLVDSFMPDPAPAAGGLSLDDVEPAAEPQDAAALLAELVAILERHLVLPPGAAIVAASWIMHTWTLDGAYFTPRLVIKSPTKRCGKSLLLEVLDALAARAIKADNITSAVLYRAIEKHRPTLLVDEADSFLPDNEELRGVLNAGFRYDGLVLRCEGDELEPRAFKCFGAVAIAAIGPLPGTLADRALTVAMARKGRGERVSRFDRRARTRLAPLRPRLARWAKDALEELRDATPEMPEALNDRQRDISEPLVAIADQAGGEWPEKVRAAILKLCGASNEDGDRRERLLAAVWEAFEAEGKDFLSLHDLVKHLLEDDSSDPEWGEAAKGDKPITSVWLARWLKPFGLTSTRPSSEGVRPRGYDRKDVEKVVAKYLGPGEGVKMPGPPGPKADKPSNSEPKRSADFTRTAPVPGPVKIPEKTNGINVGPGSPRKNPPSGEGEGDPARSFLLEALRDGPVLSERLIRRAHEERGIGRMDVLSARAGLDLATLWDEVTGAQMWGLP